MCRMPKYDCVNICYCTVHFDHSYYHPLMFFLTTLYLFPPLYE